MVSINNQSSKTLWLTDTQLETMVTEATTYAPEEVCGLLAGKHGHTLEVILTTNLLHSPVRFRMDPQEQFQAFQIIEQRGWDLLAIFHSHPHGPATPSPTDIKESYYPDVVTLILSREGDEWVCRGFNISNNEVEEVSICQVK